ncbi:hypothetical protein [Streptomyces sp. NPDC000851]
MALSKRLAELHESGDTWLADCSAHPDVVRTAWRAEKLAPIASGEHWLVAESRLVPGYPAVMRIREDLRGPVLIDPYRDRAWWLVPPNATEGLADVRQLKVQPAGWALPCPPSGEQVGGLFWLWRPDGSGRLTDPAVLAAAFVPGGYRLPTEN